MKLFLKRPEDAKDMVSRVLNLATDNADNPDLRDRGFVYWRLLSSDPEKAQKVVLCKKPVIGGNSYSTDETVTNTALDHMDRCRRRPYISSSRRHTLPITTRTSRTSHTR